MVRIKEQERFRIPILGAALLLVRGKVERDGAVVHVVLDGCEDLTSLLGSIGGVSRDFH